MRVSKYMRVLGSGLTLAIGFFASAPKALSQG